MSAGRRLLLRLPGRTNPMCGLRGSDTARLDVVHPRMWGRAEAGRMALRSAFEGGAPLLFGAMSGGWAAVRTA
ncbi:MAG TPA: hypothetical protein VND24_05830 [Steroidobacteraceae bacterium]|nr:hypothetical protein [Steroidobacteraceae bacterium]